MVIQEVFEVLRVKHFHFLKNKKPLLVGTAFALMIVEVVYGELMIRTPGVRLRQDSYFSTMAARNTTSRNIAIIASFDCYFQAIF
jgi:hypothetical protein